ncbi:glyoxylase-like metal-dependent hydrolase (beta-lactamase superfamily II) [Pseudomonas sp. TE3786]
MKNPLCCTHQALLLIILALMCAFSLMHPGLAIAAPVAKQNTQVPGYYRMALGDFEVTALYDGVNFINNKLLKGASAEAIQSSQARAFLDSSNGVQTAVNAFLINTGEHLVLVDSGAGKCLTDKLGNVQRDIEAAGYRLEQVDTLLLTHMHPDHACGVLDSKGERAFPNATLMLNKAEADYWLNPELLAKAPADKQARLKMIAASAAPYKAAGKLQLFTDGSDILPGVKDLALHGHTPGHSGYLFTSKGQKLLVWGDVVHSHSIQFAHPQVAIDFDSDSKQAIATRKHILAEATAEKFLVAGAHLPFPGIGHVRKKGTGFAWVPVEFSPLP